jgi:hypothetical protein
LPFLWTRLLTCKTYETKIKKSRRYVFLSFPDAEKSY